MASLPAGAPLPVNGEIPNPNAGAGFSAYIHVPFCQIRCGYCDFNTYTNPNFGAGAGRADYADSVVKEIEFSKEVLQRGGTPGLLQSVFFGGGTPTLLAAQSLTQILHALRNVFGFAPNAEITTEANPETITYPKLRALKEAGFNRISFGMQSAVENVLHTLDRAHTPGQAARAAQWAQELELNFSLDLIYGTPGESDTDWEESLHTAIALAPNHISAYALTIEPGTKMGRQLAHGKIPAPDEEALARRYEKANDFLEAAGYRWYEVSNWAKPGFECKHNLYYWKNANWWGYGPGAHSHFNGTRFWNVKHPVAYAARLAGNPMQTPAQGHENLCETEQLEEAIMLGIRLRDGIKVPAGVRRETISGFIADGLIDPQAVLREDRLVLTVRGRLLADSVIRGIWMDL
ncbi:radical SAM family heme chaperone HemW [Arcanobacterium hippocoleae]